MFLLALLIPVIMNKKLEPISKIYENITSFTLLLKSEQHLQYINIFWMNSDETFASDTWDVGFKSRADQIAHTLPTTRHRCNLDVWAQAQSCGDGHRSFVTPERVLREYNKDLIFWFRLLPFNISDRGARNG